MDLLAKFEQALEGLVEGVFSRAFKAPLQPVEIAKRLTREMEDHRTVSINATYVPNVYTVFLSSESLNGFEGIREQLLTELTQYLRDFTKERHYRTVGAISVRLAENEDLTGNAVQITAESEADLSSSVLPPISTTPTTSRTAAVDSIPAPSLPPQSATRLEVTAGEALGQQLPLADGLSIGRGTTNTLALTEPAISRKHAEIICDGQVWLLRDLGSTNGTFVNHRRVTAHELHPGDLIAIGSTMILVR